VEEVELLAAGTNGSASGGGPGGAGQLYPITGTSIMQVEVEEVVIITSDQIQQEQEELVEEEMVEQDQEELLHLATAGTANTGGGAGGQTVGEW
jgi:hypothetical protein